ncbi:hexosaminidase [bacterium A37T11]|nr:hexosaminidase [bacterium A37T11]
MKHFKYLVSLSGLVLILFQVQVRADIRYPLIPAPVSLKELPGDFLMDQSVRLDIQTNDERVLGSLHWFSEKIKSLTGLDLQQKKGNKRISIVLLKHNEPSLAKEGYHLKISPQNVLLEANGAEGIFYGLQSILQLLPPANKWAIPAAEITDYPRFGWRGLMLDVSRHFFTKDEVKRFIDEMVRYKFNVFHWHLTDDQGWRIEIKQLPELTRHGGFRVHREGAWGSFLPALEYEKATDGGYYTQDDIKEIVQYAAERFVTILPEIDVPGHSLAFISSYPGLNATKKQFSVNAGWRNTPRDDNALDPSNEEVYVKLDMIFTEVAKLFPNPYIHIGGDEAYKVYWEQSSNCKEFMSKNGLKNADELQSYFIKRLVKILESKGKKLIGWDEILQGGLAPEATVMSWRGMQGGIDAAKMNHEVIMTPWDYVYLDLYQGDPSAEPSTYGMCRLTDSYRFEPVPEGIDEKLILGGQGNLWTESVPTFRHLEYMLWPRSMALAEVYWSPKQSRNWPGFFERLESEFTKLDIADINYARSCYDVVVIPVQESGQSVSLTMTTEAPNLDIYYTFDETNPDLHASKYNGETLYFPPGSSNLKVVSYRGNKPIGKQLKLSKEELTKRSLQQHHVY